MGGARNLRLRSRVGLVSGLLMNAFFFYFDLTQPLGVAAGITYVAAVAIALVAQSRELVVLFGVLGCVLTLLGLFASHPVSSVSPGIIVLNRGLSVFALLTVTITGYVLISRQQRFDARLIELASTDPLTGLLNRRTLMSEAERRVEEARRYKQPLSFLMLDIDNFKNLNDEHGHLVGDQVLQAVAEVALKCARRTDYVGRYGGEEFMLVCPGVDANEASHLAERIRAETECLQGRNDLPATPVTVSVGVAEMPDETYTVRDLIAAADHCLYQAKAAGRNRVVLGFSREAALTNSESGSRS